MSKACFLPEDDQDFLSRKGIEHNLLTEKVGTETRRGVAFPGFEIPDNLCQRQNGILIPGGTATILVLIPSGYAKAKLDSWYVWPGLFMLNGSTVNCAASEQDLFGQKWQFWSRHLEDNEWRDGIDGLETYIQYIRAGLRDS